MSLWHPLLFAYLFLDNNTKQNNSTPFFLSVKSTNFPFFTNLAHRCFRELNLRQIYGEKCTGDPLCRLVEYYCC